MWQIDIIELDKKPAKIKHSYFAKLPSLDKLTRRDRFAIMTRRTSLPFAECVACQKRGKIADFIKRRQELRSLWGNNVIPFPIKELVNQ